MGIRGLQSYIDTECHHVFEKVDFKRSAAAFQEQTNLVPKLLIDVYSCTNYFYEKAMPSDSLHYGNFTEFSDYLLQLFRKFEELGIECIFFFSGDITLRKNLTEFSDHNLRKKESKEELAWLLEYGEDYKLFDFLKSKVYMREFFVNVLRMNKCEIIQSVGFAHRAVLDYITEYGCFGVLAQNTEFMFMEGIPNYFTVQHMDSAKMRTLAYCPRRFSSALGIDESLLPMFATLSGNNFTSDENLRNFHVGLLQRNYVAKKVLFPILAQWIRQHKDVLYGASGNTVASIIRIPHLEDVLQDSLDSYKLSRVAEESLPASDNWSEILNLAEVRHKRGVAKQTLSIMKTMTDRKTSEKLFHSTSFAKLFRRYYGILFKERPPKLGPIEVEEIIVGATVLRQMVSPTFPDEHPGLLYLWSDPQCSDFEKLKLLCWALSDSLSVDDILNLPSNLRLPGIALYFLLHNETTKLLNWQIEALIVLIVQLVTITVADVKKLRFGPVDMEQLRVAATFTTAWAVVSYLDDACGNPLLKGCQPIFFDHKVFNSIYNTLSNGGESLEMCEASLFNTFKTFLDIN